MPYGARNKEESNRIQSINSIQSYHSIQYMILHLRITSMYYCIAMLHTSNTRHTPHKIERSRKKEEKEKGCASFNVKGLHGFEAVTPIAGARRTEMWVGGVSCVNEPSKTQIKAKNFLRHIKRGNIM